MSFEGMDVGQVQAIARQLDANARALDGIAGLLAGLAEELILHWQGPAAARFQHEWTSQHRQALHAAAQALADMHDRVVTNIGQQQGASAADAGFAAVTGAAFAGLVGGAGTAWHVIETADEARRVVEWPIDKVREISGRHEAAEPKGDSAWAWLRRTVDDDPVSPQLKESNIVRWLHDTPAVRDADRILSDTHVYKVLDKVGPAGIVIGAAATLGDLSAAGGAAVHGHYESAGGHLVDAASDGLMTGKTVFWLGGFDIEMAKKDVEEFTQGGGVPSPFSWQNLKNDYWPTFTGLPSDAWQQRSELFKLVMGDHG